jgi:cytochrome b subunit of formate dehydrogenase
MHVNLCWIDFRGFAGSARLGRLRIATAYVASVFSGAIFGLGSLRAAESCMECHADPLLTMDRAGREVLLFVDPAQVERSAHAGFGCADCHEGLDAESIPHADPMPRVNCFGCHDGLGESHAFHRSLGTITEMSTERSADCASCHGTHEIRAVADPAFEFAPARLTQSCGECHETAKNAFLASAHNGGNGRPYPDCISCHKSDIVGSAETRLQTKVAQLELCQSCHVDTPEAAMRTRLSGKFVASWSSSIHGTALRDGNADAANCVDCHGSHEMQRAMVADSRVNKLHVGDTCRACHEQAGDEWRESVHAAALSRGVRDAPVCTDCHGEHLILATADPRAAVAPRNVSQQLCGDCHGSLKLSERYGISSDRFSTFSDSYHGLALSGGSVSVVNCASCHGAHDILRSDHPESTVHKANLVRTCGECHPGANERFAIGTVHVSMAPGSLTDWGEPDAEDFAVRVVATIYVAAIVLIVGAMFLHNALDFFKKVRRKVRGHIHGVHDESVPHKLYLRMTVNERLQHGTMVISFVLLVVTGFMLRFPEAWWVQWLRDVNDHVFELRSLIHRIAAVVMVVSGVWHAWYVFFTRRGRELIRDLMPRWSDATDAWGVVRYNLGLAKTKPKFGRFSYIEKAEYWALLWGSILMTVTGVLLWADNTTMGLFTKLGFDIARTIHYYEAILATLAIIVWHFYAVIFNPDVYPMNLSWLTGRLSEEEMMDEHPLELERLKALEQQAAVPGNEQAGVPPSEGEPASSDGAGEGRDPSQRP